MTEVERLTQELIAAKNRLAAIQVRLTEIDHERVALQKESRGLHDTGWKYSDGVIPSLERKIAKATLVQRDATRRTVVFTPETYHCAEGRWVVEKVTPKRIFIREQGRTLAEQYDRVAGGHKWRATAIDLPATFPEGVDNFQKVSTPS